VEEKKNVQEVIS